MVGAISMVTCDSSAGVLQNLWPTLCIFSVIYFLAEWSVTSNSNSQLWLYPYTENQSWLLPGKKKWSKNFSSNFMNTKFILPWRTRVLRFHQLLQCFWVVEVYPSGIHGYDVCIVSNQAHIESDFSTFSRRLPNFSHVQIDVNDMIWALIWNDQCLENSF